MIKEQSPEKEKYKCLYCDKALPLFEDRIPEFCDDYCEAQFVKLIEPGSQHQTIVPNPPLQLHNVIKKLKDIGCTNSRLFFLSPEGLKYSWRCKLWDCSVCEPRNRKRIRAQILYAASSDRGMRRFMTLTFDARHPKFLEAYRRLQEEEDSKEKEWQENHIRPMPRKSIQEFSFTYMSQVYRKFQINLARAGYKPKYYKVNVRQHDTGNCHFHLLVNLFIPQGLISDCFERAGGGEIADIRWKTADEIANYLSKYFSDDHKEEFHIPQGSRHYSTSRYLLVGFSRPQEGIRLMVYGTDNIPREVSGTDFKFSAYDIMTDFKPPP